MDKCKNCEVIKQEIEDLRIELTELAGKYSEICTRLWSIKNKKR